MGWINPSRAARLYMTKKLRQELKYLANEKSIWGEIRSIFHHF